MAKPKPQPHARSQKLEKQLAELRSRLLRESASLSVEQTQAREREIEHVMAELDEARRSGA